MSEQREPYATATSAYVIVESPVTLVTTKQKAAMLHRVEKLRNDHKRGGCARFAVVDLETLEIGSVIAFEA